MKDRQSCRIDTINNGRSVLILLFKSGLVGRQGPSTNVVLNRRIAVLRVRTSPLRTPEYYSLGKDPTLRSYKNSYIDSCHKSWHFMNQESTQSPPWANSSTSDALHQEICVSQKASAPPSLSYTTDCSNHSARRRNEQE